MSNLIKNLKTFLFLVISVSVPLTLVRPSTAAGQAAAGRKDEPPKALAITTVQNTDQNKSDSNRISFTLRPRSTTNIEPLKQEYSYWEDSLFPTYSHELEGLDTRMSSLKKMSSQLEKFNGKNRRV